MKTKKLSEVGEGKSLTDIIGINNGAVSKMPKTSISMFNSSVITIEPGASLDVGLNLNKLILIQHNGTGHIGAFLNGVTHAQLKLISSTDPNSFGVGERMITSSSEPVFGGVYKLTAIEDDGIIIPKIKISENVAL